MTTIHKASDSKKLSEGNAKTNTTRKLFPIHGERLPSDSRHCNKNKNGSFFRQYFHGKDRSRINKPFFCTKKPLLWKRYIDDVFSLWDTNKEEASTFIEQVNKS